MSHYKLYISLIATAVGLASYAPYIAGIIRNTVKPSAASWLVWTILTAAAFVAQVSAGGGIGSLTVGISAAVSLIITVLALRNSSQPMSRMDWICLGAAAISLGLWVITKNPLLSVILVSAVTLVGYVPTFLKSHSRPGEENVATYSMGIAKFAISIAALDNYSVVTTLYPAAMIAANLGLTVLLLARRSEFAARETVALKILPII